MPKLIELTRGFTKLLRIYIYIYIYIYKRRVYVLPPSVVLAGCREDYAWPAYVLIHETATSLTDCNFITRMLFYQVY